MFVEQAMAVTGHIQSKAEVNMYILLSNTENLLCILNMGLYKIYNILNRKKQNNVNNLIKF